MWISRGGHFEIQYGGHKERISSGPISENVRNIFIYICAKFGACITKCTTGLLHCYTNRNTHTHTHTTVLRDFFPRGCSNPVISTGHTSVDIGASANLEVMDKFC